MEFERILQLYLQEAQPPKSVLTVILTSWSIFAKYCFSQGLTSLQDLDPSQISGFQQSLLWEPSSRGNLYRANSVDQFLRRVRQILRWASRRGHLDQDPTRDLRLANPPRPKHALLTREELQAFFAVQDPDRLEGLRDLAFFSLMLDTDLKLQACLSLKLGDPDQLELGLTAAAWLADYLRHARPVFAQDSLDKTLFLSRTGKPWRTSGVQKRAKLIAAAAGLPKGVCPRQLRLSHQAHLAKLGQTRYFSFNRTFN